MAWKAKQAISLGWVSPESGWESEHPNLHFSFYPPGKRSSCAAASGAQLCGTASAGDLVCSQWTFFMHGAEINVHPQ